MNEKKGLLKSEPPAVAQYLIYTGAIVFLFLCVVILLNVNAFVGYWFTDVDQVWTVSTAMSK